MSAAMPAGRLLEARGLERVHHRGAEVVHALRGVDLDLDAGEVDALVGPSGSGKSSLLSVLSGWERPDGGALRWAPGLDGGALAPWSAVGVVPQALGLLDDLTVRENVALPLRLAAGDRAARRAAARAADAWLERLGLDRLADRWPREASLGEQQRAAVARALVLGPRLVLLDEPTAHQDAGWAAEVLAALREAAEAGACVVLATHAAEGRAVADRLLAMADGVLTEQPVPAPPVVTPVRAPAP